ncbi:PREDICTED: OTU domain-containing protein 4-like [Acropora digitifera]|uniref:OTU domain-containing protein 4-like n=1 Tax=Acropora digitifera TaxID=70779 RepID=UPI00077A5592|nr:PREDICTED: OTU domain-containing protein 4-like [Acropora digitifera]
MAGFVQKKENMAAMRFEPVYHCQAKHLQVRKDCIDFMRQNREKFEAFLEGPFDHHLFRLQNPKEWAGQVEISALSLMYECTRNVSVAPCIILLCYSNGNHYDAVYDNQFQKDAAICQSLVYGILYQKVFAELDKRENSAKSSKSNPPADMTSPMVFYQNGLREEDSFKDEAEDNSGWTEVKSRSSKAKSARQNKGHEQEDLKEEASKPYLDQKHGWQARRSLDPELYRNVELEVWEDSKNGQEQQDRNYAASIQYQCGDKCFAYVGPPGGEDKVYEAIVVYYLPVQGNIEVRIPELQQRRYNCTDFVYALPSKTSKFYLYD